MTGIFMLVFLIILLSSQIELKFFEYFGKCTLGVYAIHQTLLWLLEFLSTKRSYMRSFFETLSSVGIICNFAIVLALTMVVYQILSINKFTCKLLLGKD